MDIQNLIDRIIADARAEAKQIINDANVNAKENIEYAKTHRESVLKDAQETAKKTVARTKEITQAEQDLANRLELLRLKTQIVDDVFSKAMQKVKYNFRIEKKKDYELRLTREELGSRLRYEIEKQVVEILFT